MQLDDKSMIIPCIPGDGIGSEITAAMQQVVNWAVGHAYQDSRTIQWLPLEAGYSAHQAGGEWLPRSTLDALRTHKIGIKGPLTTPVGEGIRSLNVTLRQELDLFVCLRPVIWMEGLPSPHRDPQGIHIVIFRENTEDLYAGIEYQAGTAAHQAWMHMMQAQLPDDFERIPNPAECGIGIKPISKPASERLMRAALNWALQNKRKRVTIVHKGNIMKYTEGAFRTWAYDLAESEFKAHVFTRRQYDQLVARQGKQAADKEKEIASVNHQLWVDDIIADVVFEQLITQPQQFDVITTTNLNGDYLSDAAAALVGGVGISPGANINFDAGCALFEANHGSASDLAGKNLANPSSLILSAEMMLRYIGWTEAADLVNKGIRQAIISKTVTLDLASRIADATVVSTSGFAEQIVNHF